MKRLIPFLLLPSLLPLAGNAGVVASFPFDLRGGQVYETVSGNRFAVDGRFAPENVAGASGNALRLDGYSTTLDLKFNNILDNPAAATVSVWVAIEAYPIIEIDTPTTRKAPIVDALDRDARTGFAFSIGINGDWNFTCYPGGWEYTLDATKKIPRGKWVNLTAVVDPASNSARLYMNGEEVAQGRCTASFSVKGNTAKIGHSGSDSFAGPFRITSFSGMIDELTVWDEALTADRIASFKAENEADFAVSPSRFSSSVLRPKFHGQPSANWTNESHGMAYSEGRYHLFFQKNANGPYMARLHWGHISSPDLLNWKEEPIAIAPDRDYDIKGCWSGAVFTDPQITGGRPNIIYTAVDYGRAVIARATPDDLGLRQWSKPDANPLIDGRPAGLSDDFRDPYFFRNGDKAYIIVGTSKNGIGACTLHEYDASTGKWSNDGRIFYRGSSASQDGTFWEMPNITPMGNGKWLFTATPLGISKGVRTIYRIGTINDDGTFRPDADYTLPKNVEMINGEGYGLLSPTVFQKEGKTIALGIVPDKLPGETNHELGWAHAYSLPREWSLNEKNELIQRPYSGLEDLREEAGSYSADNLSLNGDVAMGDVGGAQLEADVVFTAGSVPFGIKFYQDASGEAILRVDPSTSEVEFDFTDLDRISNDRGVFDGIYTAALPERIKPGEEVSVKLFVDGSLLDLFVNDRYAASVRVFPRSTSSAGGFGASLFSEGPTVVKSVRAWRLVADPSGLEEAIQDPLLPDATSDICGIDGRTVCAAVNREDVSTVMKNLPSGIYIVGGRKVINR